MPPPEFDMNRMDASHDPPPAHPESMAGAVEQCRVWLNWAAAQIDACMAGDNVAGDQLLASLSDVLGEARNRSAVDAPGSHVANEKMSAVIVAVQSHDRVMQGFAHVADSLRALREHLGDARRAHSAESWRVLRENQFRAFSMAEERTLFARMVAYEGESWREVAVNPDENVELFVGDSGTHEP